MPWNFPFWQVFRFAAPALLAGNVGLLKHASNVPRCAIEIEALIRRAGFPEDVFQTLLIGSAAGGAGDRRRPREGRLADGERAGGRAGGRAGRAADQEDGVGIGRKRSVRGHAQRRSGPCGGGRRAIARTLNNGQSCIAAKRFIVDRRIADAFERRFVAAMEALRVATRWTRAHRLGRSPRPRFWKLYTSRCATACRWARVCSPAESRFPGRAITTRPPCWPTRRAIPRLTGGAFRPGGRAIPFDGIEDAIRLANDTEFGLGASVWTDDPAEQRRLVDEIEAGMVFINGIVVSDPRLPFGRSKALGLRP